MTYRDLMSIPGVGIDRRIHIVYELCEFLMGMPVVEDVFGVLETIESVHADHALFILRDDGRTAAYVLSRVISARGDREPVAIEDDWYGENA